MSRATLQILWSSLLSLAASGCVSLAPEQGHVLSTRYEQRFSDEAVRRDWVAMEALRGRIDAVRPGHASAYALWRAELMLDFAVDEYQENDRTTLADALLDDAQRTVASLEPGAAAPADTSWPALPAVKRIREDLWVAAERAKADPVLRECAGEPIARLEVGLLELGHNEWEVDAHMNTPEHLEPCPLIPLVDDLAAALATATAACIAPPPPPPPPPLPSVERMTLAANALFRFDRCKAADMLPAGREQLDAFGAELARDPASWQRLVITGHTDRLGRHEYNLQLSRCRAETVRDYFVEHFGLPADRFETRGFGPLQPIKFCTGPVNDALKACLQPNRRVELEVHR
ncbi:MAG: OmpA family protein [Steroidobacteraceae bacterium]